MNYHRLDLGHSLVEGIHSLEVATHNPVEEEDMDNLVEEEVGTHILVKEEDMDILMEQEVGIRSLDVEEVVMGNLVEEEEGIRNLVKVDKPAFIFLKIMLRINSFNSI